MENVNHKNYYKKKREEKKQKNMTKKDKSVTREKIKSDIVIVKNLSYFINKILFWFKRLI